MNTLQQDMPGQVPSSPAAAPPAARTAASHTGSMVSGDMAMDVVCRASGRRSRALPRASWSTSAPSWSPVPPPSGHASRHRRRRRSRHRGQRRRRAGRLLGTTAGEARQALALARLRSQPGRHDRREQEFATFSPDVTDRAHFGEVDSIVDSGYLDAYGRDSTERAEQELQICAEVGEAAERSGVPVVVHFMAADSDSSGALRRRGVPVLARIEAATQAMALVSRRAARWPLRLERDRIVAADAYTAAHKLLLEHRAVFPDACGIGTAIEAVEAAEQVGFPVVVKLLDVDHKTEVEGVVSTCAMPRTSVPSAPT